MCEWSGWGGGGGGGRFGHSKIQNFTRAFHFDPSYGFTGSICGSIYAPNWYQNSPISMRLNLPIQQHHSGLTHCDAFLGIKWLLLYISRGSNYPPAMMSKPLSCREKMSAFYRAPVTKFWANVVSIGSLQEPNKWSLHLPYKPLESTLSRVDL